MKKKYFICFLIFLICHLVIISCVSTPETPAETEDTSTDIKEEEKPTAEPTPKPSPAPTKVPETTKEPLPEIGECWIKTPEEPVTSGSEFSVELLINTGEQNLAAYGFEVTFDASVININPDIGNNGVEPGPMGFLTAVNINEAQFGKMRLAGFDTAGKKASARFHLCTIHFKAVKKGNATILINVDQLVDANITPIGKPVGRETTIEIQ